MSRPRWSRRLSSFASCAWTSLITTWRRIAQPFGDAFDDALPLRLTLIVLLLRPPGEGLLRGLTWLAAAAGLAVPALARSATLWLVLALAVGARLVADFPLADNHIYLLAYWCLGVGLVLAATSVTDAAVRTAALQAMSRWLIAAAFLCAVVWKGVLSPDFLDTRFFRVTLLTDVRFAPLASAVGGLTPRELTETRAALRPLPADVEVVNGPTVVEPRSLRGLAALLTWGGLLLEALVAAAFLCARPRWMVGLRHPALMVFCAGTYAIAPVAGFGWLLTVLGMTARGPGAPGEQAAYVGLFAVVLVYAETPAVASVLQWLAP